MEQQKENSDKCPTCDSPDPRMHPATSSEGEVVAVCNDNFHSRRPDTHGQPAPQQREMRYY